MGLSSVRLLFCEEVGTFCGGVIRGSGSERFCGRLSVECNVRSHKSQKVVLRENHLYIRAPRGDQVLTENSLDAALLPDGKAAQLMNSSKPVDVWITYFLSLIAPKQGGGIVSGVPMSGSSSAGSEWEEVGLQGAGSPPSLEDFERARDNLRTPKRLKVGPLLASLVDTNPAGGLDLAPLVVA